MRTLFALTCSLCTSLMVCAQEPMDTATVDHAVYLIGDAGQAGKQFNGAVYDLLERTSTSDRANARTLVFLGDNLFPAGMHRKSSRSRKTDEAIINGHLQIAKRMDAIPVLIPGEKDWNKGGEKGRKFLERQEDFIDKQFEDDTFRPDNGCPGPEDQKLGEYATLIAMDTQWWLHRYRRGEGEKDGCDALTQNDVLFELNEKLKDAAKGRVVVVGHHPMFSFGHHGGYFGLKDHIFPLTSLNKNLYVPLPLLGSLYPLGRKLFGNDQDVNNARYRNMRDNILKTFSQYPGMIYASAHDNSLQLLMQDSLHFIVSGAGSTTDLLVRSKKLKYGESERGFSRLLIMTDGSVQVQFFTVKNDTTPSYEEWLLGPQPEVIEKEIAESIVVEKPLFAAITEDTPNEDLAASGLHQVFFGALYRDIWTNPIEVPVLDIDTAYGGLEPEKMGGGKQTRSLRLLDTNDRKYNLRTIKKYPGLALDPELRRTVVEDIVTDGIAASMPYGALVVTPLARAIGVYHTQPRMVFVPNTPQLGEFQDDLGNTLCILEESPDDDWSEHSNFGNSKKIISSADMMEELRGSYKHQLDQRVMLRARLLDVLIGDWDRHDDQWRWASFEHDELTTYKPIPRDRDQAFFTVDGLFPNVINRKWGARMLQNFGPGIRDMKGLNHAAQQVDHAYLTALEWKDWEEITDSIRSDLTDEVIDQAVATLPQIAQQKFGDELKAGLRNRRDDLIDHARTFYLDISRHVDVVGTDNDDYFEIERLDNDRTSVSIYDRENNDKVDDRRYYHRVFQRSETKEIRIYGLEGNDEYVTSGTVGKGIKIRIIGGFDKDEFKDNARVKGLSAKTVVYETDEQEGRKNMKLSSDTRLVVKEERNAIDYDRSDHSYDHLMPLIRFGFNPDDAVFLGGGFRLTRQGFKVAPYKWQHQLTASMAFRTKAFTVDYRGRVKNVFGKFGFGLDAGLIAPDYNLNFFGFGNETARDLPDDAFVYEVDIIKGKFFLDRSFGQVHRFTLGPTYYKAGPELLVQGTEVDAELEPFQAQAVEYVGAEMSYTLSNKDSEHDPSRGIKFQLIADQMREVSSNYDLYGIQSALSLYIPLAILPSRTVLALRGGAGRRYGPIDPTQAMRLGGSEQMRGLRRGRFSGNSNAYLNSELRIDLLKSHNTFVPFRVGLIGLFDAGRVWVDGPEPEGELHRSYGGGFFISPLNMLVLQGTYAVSDDDNIVDLRLGFFF